MAKVTFTDTTGKSVEIEVLDAVEVVPRESGLRPVLVIGDRAIAQRAMLDVTMFTKPIEFRGTVVRMNDPGDLRLSVEAIREELAERFRKLADDAAPAVQKLSHAIRDLSARTSEMLDHAVKVRAPSPARKAKKTRYAPTRVDTLELSALGLSRAQIRGLELPPKGGNAHQRRLRKRAIQRAVKATTVQREEP